MAKIEEFYLTDFSYMGDFLISDSGDFELSSGLKNLQQAILHRLLTTPGSLIHRPNYGIGIKRFQNALNSSANQSEIFTACREQFSDDIRIEAVTGIRFEINDARPDMTKIVLRIKPRGYDEQVFNFIPFGDVA